MINSLTEAILNTNKGLNNNESNDVALKDILYSPWATRYSKTIEEFYEEFVKVRLPEKNVVEAWHRLLVEYSKEPGAIFPIRAGNTKGKLRRGWVVRIDKDFSYMFTDNDLAVYIYKMALDGYCPKLEDFYDFMTKFKPLTEIGWLEDKEVKNASCAEGERHFLGMPVHFHQIGGSTYPDKMESEKNAYINAAPAPACCLGEYGYKHAHIFDVKGKYTIGGKTVEWKELNKVELGESQDYKWDSAINNFVWDRNITHSDEKKELKAIVVAHFLRFLDPLNHFLAPMQGNNKFTKSDGEYSLDIAEYENFQKYMIAKKAKIFVDFDDYQEKICTSKECLGTCENYGAEKIDIVYHEKTMAKRYYKTAARRQKNTNSGGSLKNASKYKKTTNLSQIKDEFSGFVKYMLNTGMRSANTYKTNIKTVMKDMNISDVEELKQRLEELINNYTGKTAKQGNDCRAALKKYKVFLEHND